MLIMAIIRNQLGWLLTPITADQTPYLHIVFPSSTGLLQGKAQLCECWFLHPLTIDTK